MRIRALAKRIAHQFRADKRTMALMFVAPLFLLTLVYFILDDNQQDLHIAVSNAPLDVVQKLEDQHFRVHRMTDGQGHDALAVGDVIAVIGWENGGLTVDLDGSDNAQAKRVVAAIQMVAMGEMPRPAFSYDIRYVYGYDGIGMFDNFGAVLIGFIVFFFVFLVAGISFLQERTSGTLEKLLSTPIKRWEIVAGYTLGFGMLTVLQSALVAFYAVYVLKVMMVGSFALVLLIIILAAISALTLGILLSTAAHNEFQMIQFVPVVIIPQFFFSGMFDLSPALAMLGRMMPLYYVADALTEVMLKGAGFGAIAVDLLALTVCSVVFMLLNTLLLKRHRRI